MTEARRRYYTKVTRKGQVTVPAEIRRKLKISEGDVVSFAIEDGAIAFEPAGSWTAQTAGLFRRRGAPVLSDRGLKDAAERAIAEDVMERRRRS